MALAGSAPCVDIEQLRRHVAHPFRGLAPRLAPLLAAKAVQGRVFRCRARVAADEVQGGHGHIELGLLGVFQGEEFRFVSAYREFLQAQETAHAMILMYHRCPHVQVGEILDDDIGIARRTDLAGAALRRPFPEQLRFGDDRQRRGFQQQALFQGGHGNGRVDVAGEEGRPVVHGGDPDAEVAQLIAQGLTASGGLGAEQHTPRVIAQKFLQGFRRVLGARLDAQFRQGRGGEVMAVRPGLHLFEALHADTTVSGFRLAQFIEIEEQARGRQQGPFAVMTAGFKAFFGLGPEALRGFFRIGQTHHQGVAGQVVEQGGGGLEEQWQIVLDTGRCQSLTDIPVDQAGLWISLELDAELGPETGDGRLVEGELAGRQHADSVHLFQGTLGLGVEGADGFHLVVEQVDAEGDRAAHGEQVQQRAAHREFPVFHHLGYTGIAGLFQPQPQGLHIKALALVQQQAVLVQVGARRQAL